MATPEFNQKLSPKEVARQEATALLQTLREKEGKKALVLVADADEHIRHVLGIFFTERVDKRDTAYVLSKQDGGASTVRLYQAFREQDSQENPTKVFAVLRGSLNHKERGYRTAQEVGQKLVEVSTANGWEAPYFIGAHTNIFEHSNIQQLKHKHPDQYLSEIPRIHSVLVAALVPGSDPQLSVLNAIDSKLEPPQKK